MLARLATPNDVSRLKEWLGDGINDYDFNRDAIFVVEDKNEICGILAARPVQFGYGLKLRDERNPLRRSMTEALLNYSRGFGLAAGQSEVIFCVNERNTAFQRFLEENFVHKESGELYTMRLK